MTLSLGFAFAILLLTGYTSPDLTSVVQFDTEKAITQYQHDVWEIEEGIPQNTVSSVVQTQDGYLWLGTEEGLVRFNGTTFDVYDRTNTPVFEESHYIRTLLEDEQGRLWIGTSSGLIVYQHGIFRQASVDNSLNGKVISSLTFDSEGQLWVGTFDSGLYACAPDQCDSFTKQPGIDSDLIGSLLTDSTGTLWIGTDVGLYRHASGTVEQIPSLANQFIMSITEDREEGLWIGTRESGIFRYTKDEFIQMPASEGWPTESVWAMQQDKAGSLWIGLGQNGLIRYRRGTFESFPPLHGLSEGRVMTIHGDRHGNLWIGTEGDGLHRLRTGVFTTYTESEGLTNDAVLSVYEDRNETLWIGTQGGGLNRLTGNDLQAITTENGLSNDVVTSIVETRDGNLWVGTLGGGLNRINDNNISILSTKDGLPSEAIFSLYEGAGGGLWIGTDKGLGYYKDGNIKTFTTEDGLPSNFITALLQDQEGTLWIGTYDAGLVKLEHGRIVPFGYNDQLGSEVVLAFYEDEKGAMWIGTYGGGLSYLQDDTIHTFNTRNGLFDDNVYVILEDSNGYIWMTSNRGIFKVNKSDIQAFIDGNIDRLTSLSYNRKDGLKSHEVNGGVQPAGWRGRDGRLWFPTIRGVAVTDPYLENNEPPPTVVIENVTVDYEPVDQTDDVTFSPGSKRIAFDFAAITFLAPEDVKFRYRLEGYDNEWSEETQHPVATYTHLDPGNYTFHVIASNRPGTWTEAGASMSFYLEPFFYERPLFWWFSALGALFMIIAAYRLRTKQLITQKERLEEAVEKRTHDLLEAKGKIQTQADALQNALDEQNTLLREKEVLLKEIHHRVKNSFQVISSLLHFQSKKSPDQETIDLFRECRDRIRSMAMIHERLYQSDDLARIDFANYLRSVIGELSRSYSGMEQQIRIDMDFRDNQLSVERAIPLGLIVNELISNAYKHAFQNRTEGLIKVSFKRSESTYHLTVSDDGLGLPEGFQLTQNPSLGLKLVDALTKKLKGEVFVTTDSGATFSIVFPAESEEPNKPTASVAATA